MANTALVLAGGGSTGAFEVGAVKFLYQQGVRPDIICGCSVGALNAARLAEGFDAQLRLEREWRGLSANSDMWQMEPWLAEIDSAVSHYLGGAASGFVESLTHAVGIDPLVSYAIGLTGIPSYFFTGPGTMASLVEMGITTARVKDGLDKAADAKSIYNLSPTRTRLGAAGSGLDRDKILKSGIKLRMGMVSLESGKIHFLDENGRFVLTTDLSGALVPGSNTALVDLVDAVIASASIPFAFPPVVIAGENFVDGGVRAMIPIGAALACGAQTVFAVTASPVETAPWQIGGHPPFMSIAMRALSEIMPDQIQLANLFPSGGSWPIPTWPIPITRISPTLVINDGLTIDRGLIEISIDYGYMRAADILADPTNAKGLQASSDAITRTRVSIWQTESYVAGVYPPGTPPSNLRPVADPQELATVRRLKTDLRQIVLTRQAAGGVLPADCSDWWRSWEKHPFALPNPSPWDRFVSKLGALDAAMAPSPTFPYAGSLRTEFSDFDGDGKSDLAVWRPSTAEWWVSGLPTTIWGQAGDIPVPGDYNGDGKTDFAIWRPQTGEWWVLGLPTQQWGQPGDLPVPGDYDGDGKTDFAIWRPGTAEWWVFGLPAKTWGQVGDIPVPGDYDGDGKTDFAVWRPGTGEWRVVYSSDNTEHIQQWGLAGDIPVPGDLDGDGRTDFAIWRPGTPSKMLPGISEWWLFNSSDAKQSTQPLGQAGDMPVLGDYDGGCRTNLAVWRPSTGEWFQLVGVLGSQTLRTTQWGQTGDIPLPKVIVPPPPPPPPPPGQLVVTVVPATIAMETPVQIIVTVVDSLNGQAVQGSQVVIQNYTAHTGSSGGDSDIVQQSDRGVPFTKLITFHYGKETDPETHAVKFDLEPVIQATAPGYQGAVASATFH